MESRLLTCLGRRLDAAAAGCGSAVLIAVADGSSVGAQAAASARSANGGDVRVLAGRCGRCAGETPPFGPWRALLGPAAAERLLRGDAPPAAKAAGLLAWLAERPEPALLLLENLQGADPASLELSVQVARLAPMHRLVFLATYCPDDLHRAHPLFGALADLARAGVSTLRLSAPENSTTPEQAEAPPSLTAHLHRAETLLAEPEPEAWAVAYHLFQARDPRAPTWLGRACESALAFGDVAQAAQACEWALELLPPGDPAQLPFLIRLGLCHCRLGNFRQGLDCLDEAMASTRIHRSSGTRPAP
jgi:tetratricopeptide (TPR) repeat protein